jgi:hypothetical protein
MLRKHAGVLIYAERHPVNERVQAPRIVPLNLAAFNILRTPNWATVGEHGPVGRALVRVSSSQDSDSHKRLDACEIP